MKLADIRCETCPQFDKHGAIGKYKGWCKTYGGVRYVDDMCSAHPLWEQALAEEEALALVVSLRAAIDAARESSNAPKD